MSIIITSQHSLIDLLEIFQKTCFNFSVLSRSSWFIEILEVLRGSSRTNEQLEKLFHFLDLR